MVPHRKVTGSVPQCDLKLQDIEIAPNTFSMSDHQVMVVKIETEIPGFS
jgi:hypothetical protein